MALFGILARLPVVEYVCLLDIEPYRRSVPLPYCNRIQPLALFFSASLPDVTNTRRALGHTKIIMDPFAATADRFPLFFVAPFAHDDHVVCHALTAGCGIFAQLLV